VIGDLNGDGKQDLVTANNGGISVLQTRGDGSFEAKRDYAAGGASVAIGDMNGDGKPDLVTANFRGISVLRNRGDGSFETKRDYAVGGAPSLIAIGDMNGDGKPDLVTSNGGDERQPVTTISVLANRGDGSFEAERDYATGEPGGLSPVSVAIGDLNGDGKPDLATANATTSRTLEDWQCCDANTVSVLRNRGDGSFEAKRGYATGEVPGSVAIGDLDGNGNPDLVTAGGNSVSVLRNRGDGSFEAKRDYATGRGAVSVAIGDLDGDGKPELATANADANTVSVLRNRGDGSFQAKLDYPTGRYPLSVAIGDLNGDGKPDLASANCAYSPDAFRCTGEYTVSVLLNTTG
jgi:hypothetical protein